MNKKYTDDRCCKTEKLYKIYDKVERSARIITILLNEREIRWNDKQKAKGVERIALKLKKASKEKHYIKKLLKDCKTCSGPFKSGEELIRAIKLRPEKENFIVKTEMACFSHTHSSDKKQQPELYKLNRISFEEKLEKLLVLLTDDSKQSTATIAHLPNNDDAMIHISNTLSPEKKND